jgi:cysteine desulfurase
MADVIYLDWAATAPLHPAVREKVPEWMDVFGNPSSLHRLGMEAENVLSEARRTMLESLGARGGQFVFTGGGTEANNLAIFGSVFAQRDRHAHVVTTAVEHPAVLEAYRRLEQLGYEVSYVRPREDGDLDWTDVIRAVREDTVLVSVMHVNNETGAVFPIERLAQELDKFPRVRFHVDGTQAFGKIPFSVGDHAIDLYACSAHKVGGLKGVGGLYIRPRVKLDPHVVGGGQEFGFRSGTENVLGAIAFATAAKASVDAVHRQLPYAGERRRRFVEGLRAIPGWNVIDPPNVSPYIVCATLPGLKGEVIVHAFEEQGLYVSAGSACSSARSRQKRSHVLEAMNIRREWADAAVRFSWHPTTTDDELNQALQVVERQSTWLLRMLGR